MQRSFFRTPQLESLDQVFLAASRMLFQMLQNLGFYPFGLVDVACRDLVLAMGQADIGYQQRIGQQCRLADRASWGLISQKTS